MQQGTDFSSSYYPHHYPAPNPNPNPNPNPSEFPPSNSIHPISASAPPYSHYSSPDFAPYSTPSPYPQFPQNPDPNLPPSAPSYAPIPNSQSQPPQFPPFQPYNPSPFPPDPSPNSYPHLQQPYYPTDPNPPTSANYTPNPNPNPNPGPLSHPNPTISPNYHTYDNPYEGARFDLGGGGYYNDGPVNYGLNTPGTLGRSRSGFDQDYYEKKPDAGFLYDRPASHDDGMGEGVYRYDGGRVEPYGARGTGSTMSSWSSIDDYGRSTSFSSMGKDQAGSTGKIVRAVPKLDSQQDAKNGVQKFRVKLLPEGAGSTMDVLCQIGLDGVRMLDPSTNRTLRIYPLETVTRWEVTDPSIYTFWSKSSVDIEPRRIRLQSNRYTTSTILDTVTAATVQLKEMGGKDSFDKSKGMTDASKPSEQQTEKKKGLVDWMNLIKPINEEKDHWVPDEATTKCTSCGTDFGAFVRRHHCRNCGDIFCDKCTQGRIALTADDIQPVRVCDRCMAEVSQRLSTAKEAVNKSGIVHTHEDLAKKLQEEMEKKFKLSSSSSSGTKSSADGSGKRMREVACPTCTVHLQVQVPTSGSETVECGVCQHPFLVSAH